VYRSSNKAHPARQILSSYGRQHAIQMRLLILEFLPGAGADLPLEVVEHLEETLTALSAPPVHRRMLNGHRDDVPDVADFGRALKVSPETIWRELIRYSRLSLPLGRRPPEDPAILQSLPVELLRQIKIPVLMFLEIDVYNIHRAWCTGDRVFRNQVSRNDSVWIHHGGEQGMVRSGGVCPPSSSLEKKLGTTGTRKRSTASQVFK